eukprot:TRINITY_DN53838_c0_g1_i1.p1 TRINITY_DN53838_c0_g1~~TRINITY_DN53838_c0_g1_i1.p1  ORF type:complete len:197 (-),score=41.81 TRINITY_DN53838_c0_g1_i1:9-542(-)
MEVDEEGIFNQQGGGMNQGQNNGEDKLKLLCVYGVDSEGRQSEPALDVVQQQMNGFAEVEVIQGGLSQVDLQQRIESFQPQITIFIGAQDGDLITGTLGPLNFTKEGGEEGDAEGENNINNNNQSIEQFSGESLAACFEGSSVETVLIAAPIHDHHEHIRQFGVSFVVFEYGRRRCF